MRLHHLLRMAQWARNPPSARRVVLVLSVVAICLALAALEWAGYVPDNFGLTPDRPRLQARPLP